MARKGFQDRAVNKFRTRSRGVVPRDPRVFESLFSSHALHGIHHQQALNEISSRTGQSIPTLGFVNLNHATPDPRPDLCLGALGSEGQLDHEESEDDDSKAPEVALGAVLPIKNLRCLVPDCAAALVHRHSWLDVLAETKIYKLQRTFAGSRSLENEICRLQVAMHDPSFVQIIHRQQHLKGHLCRLAFVEAPGPLQAIKKSTPSQMLHDQVHPPRRLIHVFQPRNVRVVGSESDGHLRGKSGRLVDINL
mmetsp:Transcript_51785/g.131528  ORF Transcript_51785/g.131528 Transcript_51785/m.131528 type:complete len:250 (-) Transcript_51785:276-1025(-)